ncbi:uncharacterized protein TNCV_2499131 [Trichonephila clavipes]|nr:uncharacterized protein TNCV_2499131 [Trichonephila clavipes]
MVGLKKPAHLKISHISLSWLQGVPATIHQNMQFMHDGTPVRFSIVVLYHLITTYPGRWIGCSGPVAWPPCSLDLNPLDFFL